MDTEKLKADLKSSHENLKDSIDLFHKGRRNQYQNVASILRKLICDISEKSFNQGKSNPSLLPKLKEEIKLPKIGENISTHNDKNDLTRDEILKYSIYLPGMTQTSADGKSKIIQLFQENSDMLDLNSWLNQIVMIVNDEVITIYQLIKSIADKESVHADDEYNTTIKSSKQYISGDDESRAIYIIAIGELILKYLDNGLKLDPKDILKMHEISGNLTGTYTFKGFMPKSNYTIIKTVKDDEKL